MGVCNMPAERVQSSSPVRKSIGYGKFVPPYGAEFLIGGKHPEFINLL
jgi:hypothetical protein